MEHRNESPIVIFGGNGFVGTAICELAVKSGIKCISISRSGAPLTQGLQHKASQQPSTSWVKGDAMAPDISMLEGTKAIINLVGSAPLPTFSTAAFAQQLMMNGETHSKVLQAAELAGVNRVIVMGADIPQPLQNDSFAYYRGKKQAFNAAKSFAKSSTARQAAVLQPAAIYGTRQLNNGMQLPLTWFMSPISSIQQRLPQSVQRFLPAAFVDVKKVAKAALDLAIADDISHIDRRAETAEGFLQVSNQQLIQWPACNTKL